MDKLIELVNIVNRNKVKSIGVIGRPSGNDTLLNKFYDAIHDQKVKTEEEALVYLYGKSNNKKAYYKLKHQLKERLLNTLFLIDVKESKYSDRNKAYLESQKGMMALNFVINAGIARKTAMWISEKLLKTATKWCFTEVAITTARFLRSYHASKSGDRKKIEKYDQIVRDYQELYNAEILVESFYCDLVSYYVIDKSTKRFIYDLADKHIREIKRYDPKIKSTRFYYQKAMLEIAKYMSINDYQKTKTLCEEALSNLNSFNYQDTKAIVAISYQLVVCCVQLKQYKEGKKHIDIIIAIQTPDTFNWFKAYELYVNLCFHTQQYEEAWKTFDKISKNKKFRYLPKNVKEVWKIFEAWLNLLAQIGNISSDTAAKSKGKFRVSKFINEMSIYAKDKKGLNIPILIIHTLLLIQQKKYDLLIDRIEAIEKYIHRYIKRTDNRRSYYIVRMILEIPKNDFNAILIQKKTEKHFNQLKQIPLDVSSQSHDLEIIPYEDTWALILELLS